MHDTRCNTHNDGRQPIAIGHLSILGDLINFKFLSLLKKLIYINFKVLMKLKQLLGHVSLYNIHCNPNIKLLKISN